MSMFDIYFFTFSFVFLAIVLFAFSMLWKMKRGNPFLWFLIFQSIMAIGTFYLLDFNKIPHLYYAMLILLSVIIYTVFGLLSVLNNKWSLSYRNWYSKPIINENKSQKLIVVSIFIISVLATVYYYYIVGANMLLLMLAGSVIDDFSTLRLSFYSGDEYFAPGYFNQFKNVLLPVSGTIIALWLKNGKRYIFLCFFIPILIISLMGTGQRIYIMGFFISILFTGYIFNSNFHINIKTLIFGAVVLILFGWLTTIYQSHLQSNSIFNVLSSISHRIFITQQHGALVGFEEIFTRDIVWFREWWQSVIGILPGRSGSMLSHEIHAIIYGSFRGTAPLSPVGSAYHNGGVFGVILLYSILGILYSKLIFNLFNNKKTVSNIVIYGFIFYYLSSYVAGSPVALIDNGVLTLFILFYLLRFKY